MGEKVRLSDEEWQARLTREQYLVLRQGGTEPAFTGAYWDLKDAGVYRCAGCGTGLFSSEAKYDSKTGWPSFFESLDEHKVALREDHSHLMVRTEVLCATCEGHLGHVFHDGPPPTGKRYCINSVALAFDSAG